MLAIDNFIYREEEFCAEQVSLSKLAQEYGTPLFVYSAKAIKSAYMAYHDGFHRFNPVICYAVKANSNIEILRMLGELGAGADIVSGGELYRAVRANIPPNKIVFAGVGKTREEIHFALKQNVLLFNVESASELRLISEVAKADGVSAPIAIRVNPDVDPMTHPYISTGLKKNKFGVSIEQAHELYLEGARDPHLDMLGLHMHIGSQLTDISPYKDSLMKALELIKTLRRHEIDLKYLDIGGGLGIRYDSEEPPEPVELANLLEPLLRETGCQLILEPGRSIVGNAGVLLTKIIHCKESEVKRFYIVDAAMNDLARPSLYDAYHHILPLKENDSEKHLHDVVGPICESGDFLAKDRELPLLNSGDFLAVLGAGAYGMSMSSNYNSRRRAAEILVDGDTIRLIRKRETYEDLIKNEL